jgi:ribonuclease-3
VLEAVIGACYLYAGFERTAAAVVEAFAEQIDEALENPVDFKSALQELLARRGETVAYEVTEQSGPPHDRTFSVAARVGETVVAHGSGRSKKLAEQDAARAAIEATATVPGSGAQLRGGPRVSGWRAE